MAKSRFDFLDTASCIKSGYYTSDADIEYLNGVLSELNTKSVSPLQQQAFATDILNIIRTKVDPQAVIAGGAPRNWYFDKPANDYDVYLRLPIAESRGALRHIEKALSGYKITIVKDICGDNYDFGIDITRVITTTIDQHPTPFQFIIVSDEDVRLLNDALCKVVVSHFDASICRTYFDGNRTHYTKEFCRTIETGEVVVYYKERSKCMVDYSLAVHIPKLVSYYPFYNYKLED